MSHAAWLQLKSFAQFNPDLENFQAFHEIVRMLSAEEPVHIARYNDGEWLFMLAIEPAYSIFIEKNRHKKADVQIIGKKLLDIIDSKPPYLIGIDSNTQAFQGYIAGAKSIIKEKMKDLNLVYGEIFNAATTMYGFDALKQPLSKRLVITVGPGYMQKLRLSEHHILVPVNNCWREAAEIEAALEKKIVEHLEKKPVVVYSCSLLAKLLVDVFYKKYGTVISQLDIGSCIDPWCGLSTRPWHREVGRLYGINLKPYAAAGATPGLSVSTGLSAPVDYSSKSLPSALTGSLVNKIPVIASIEPAVPIECSHNKLPPIPAVPPKPAVLPVLSVPEVKPVAPAKVAAPLVAETKPILPAKPIAPVGKTNPPVIPLKPPKNLTPRAPTASISTGLPAPVDYSTKNSPFQH